MYSALPPSPLDGNAFLGRPALQTVAAGVGADAGHSRRLTHPALARRGRGTGLDAGVPEATLSTGGARPEQRMARRYTLQRDVAIRIRDIRGEGKVLRVRVPKVDGQVEADLGRSVSLEHSAGVVVLVRVVGNGLVEEVVLAGVPVGLVGALDGVGGKFRPRVVVVVVGVDEIVPNSLRRLLRYARGDGLLLLPLGRHHGGEDCVVRTQAGFDGEGDPAWIFQIPLDGAEIARPSTVTRYV